MDLAIHIRRKRSCLFLATGPSKIYAPEWIPHFDTLVTMQQALLDVSIDVDYATFIDWDVIDTFSLCDAFPRVRRFLCPEVLMHSGDVNNIRTLEEVGIPRERAVTWPRILNRGDRGDADRCILREGVPFFVCGTPVTIHILAMLGYQEIFCLGHNDLNGEVEGYYRLPRSSCEVAADAVAERYGCRVTFWMPGMEPEGWRSDPRRGFAVAR